MQLIKRYKFVCLFILLTLTAYGCKDSTTGPGSTTDKLASRQPTGSSAKDLLTDATYNKLSVEIDYMPDNKPEPGAMDSLRSFLMRHLHKSAITLQAPTQIPSGGKDTYTIDDIVNLEDKYRDTYTTSGSTTLNIYIIITDGKYSDNNVLGVAYYNTSTAFFGAEIKSATIGIGAPSRKKVEGTVFEHEFGHLMGLVDNGTPMQTPHKTSGSAHCTTEGCLMQPSVQTGNFFKNFSEDIPDLDSLCIQDLQANGGK